jgi:nitrate/TMAO reductase-like tetraheme cytochrome c subunit
LVGCIIVFGGGYGVLSFTNSPSFCSSCHEMAPEYSTYTASAHNQISCVQCHIKPGVVNMLTHKVKSLKEVYYHVTGVPNQIVQTEEEAVSNQNCLQCHSENRKVTASGDLKVDHKKHIDEGIPCITCHSGVVHAKMAARELNVGKDRSEWTSKQNAEKLIEEKYLRPNMGTCIDCHNKVNKGEKPWEEIAYSIPTNPEEAEKAKETEKAPTGNTEETKQDTQEIILQAIGTNKTNGKLSMECKTCHQSEEIGIPKNHQAADFDKNHGPASVQQLDKCVTCHQDSNWTKEIPKQDIMTLLKYGNKAPKYVPNAEAAKEEAKINTFCNTCHTNLPSNT